MTAAVPPWHERPLRFRFLKRACDLLVAVPCFALTLPMQALLAVTIRLDSPGPALFRQIRLKLGGRPFVFYKFRTMYVDARDRFPELYDYQAIVASGGHVPLKRPHDPRLTRVGRWVRASSLDELPNLWHVIRGEMSLVGPRPELPELVPCYSPEQLQILRVKPGLTGLPQVRGRNRLTVAETLALDLEYARTTGIVLDLKILWSTMATVLMGRDAY